VETNVYLIDRTTMEAVRGGPFRGFRPGDRMMFAIGRSTNSQRRQDDRIWSGEGGGGETLGELGDGPAPGGHGFSMVRNTPGAWIGGSGGSLLRF
jgi:hypothetical protein